MTRSPAASSVHPPFHACLIDAVRMPADYADRPWCASDHSLSPAMNGPSQVQLELPLPRSCARVGPHWANAAVSQGPYSSSTKIYAG